MRSRGGDLNLPVALPSTESWVLLSSVNISRKRRDLVVDVVQRHKPSFIHKTLANNFISLAAGDISALQGSRDLGGISWQSETEPTTSAPLGLKMRRKEEEGSEHSWVGPSCRDRCHIKLYQLVVD